MRATLRADLTIYDIRVDCSRTSRRALNTYAYAVTISLAVGQDSLAIARLRDTQAYSASLSQQFASNPAITSTPSIITIDSYIERSSTNDSTSSSTSTIILICSITGSAILIAVSVWLICRYKKSSGRENPPQATVEANPTNLGTEVGLKQDLEPVEAPPQDDGEDQGEPLTSDAIWRSVVLPGESFQGRRE